MKLAILGAGAYGTALGNLATENGHEIKYYDPLKFPEEARPGNSLKSVIADADAILFVAPAKTAEKTISAIANEIPEVAENTPLICASKGFLAKKPFAKIKNFSALGGAAFAEDIESETPRLGNKIVLTASSELSEQLFSTEFLTVEYTPDTFGIMLCGALKNIYAIGAGLENVNVNLKNAVAASENKTEVNKTYFENVYEELKSFLAENGADPETAKLSCGLPDLLMSVAGNSRNYLYGKSLAENAKNAKSAETTKNQTSPNNPLAEGVTAIESLKNSDLKIPETATIFKNIVERITHAPK